MNRYLILVAGSPATGKSNIVNKLLNKYRDAVLIVPDDIKEMYADLRGFSNLDEKKELEKYVWEHYYTLLSRYMEMCSRIIVTEYPFSMKQLDKLNYFSEKYGYEVVTIRLTADFDILWQRRYKRDRDQSRHLSHLVKSYHYGMQMHDRNQADNHISKNDFQKIIDDRQYDKFTLGQTIELDMTDFDKVDYNSLGTFLEHNIVLD